MHSRTRAAETLQEASFVQSFGAKLDEAERWLDRYSETNEARDLLRAWDHYHRVYQRVTRMVTRLNTMDLNTVSPKLLAAKVGERE